MKTLSMLFIAGLFSVTVLAQNNYEAAMETALNNFENADSTKELQAVAAQFERIANAEQNEWLPQYYASMTNCNLAFMTEDIQKKEMYINQSQSWLDKAMKIISDESELYTLQGLIYQAYIGIDPENNGRIYSSKANGSLQTAIKLNAENPRPYYLQAMMILYTPEQFGGGKQAALPLFEKAMELFNKSESGNTLLPDWGKTDCEQYIITCREQQAR